MAGPWRNRAPGATRVVPVYGFLRLRQRCATALAAPHLRHQRQYGVTAMVHAIRIHQPGGPEVMKWESVEVPAPGPGQVRLKQHAVGVNYIDVYQRSGLYKMPTPFVAGSEGAGEVVAVGPGVTDFKVGDRGAYAGAGGGYAEERGMPADRLVELPDKIDY